MIAIIGLAQKCKGLVSLACNYSIEVFAGRVRATANQEIATLTVSLKHCFFWPFSLCSCGVSVEMF